MEIAVDAKYVLVSVAYRKFLRFVGCKATESEVNLYNGDKIE